MSREGKIGRNDPCPCGSGRKYKICCLLKQEDDLENKPKHGTLILSEKVPLVSFDKLAQFMEEQKCDPYAVALAAIEEARENFGLDGFSLSRKYHVWNLGALILAAFFRKSIPPVPNENFGIMNKNGFLYLLTMATGIDFSLNDDARNQRENIKRAELRVLRMLTQVAFQGEFIHQMARTFYLLGLEEIAPEFSNEQCIFDNLFQAAYGCSTREYAAILLGLWTRGDEYSAFFVSKVFESSPSRDRLTAALGRILKDRSCHVSEISDKVSGEYQLYEDEGLVTAFFSRYPYLGISDDFFLSSPHPYLRLGAFNGVYFNALELARKDAKLRGSRKPETNEYSTQLGKRFENLVYFTLSSIYDGGDIQREYKYLSKSNEKSSDFIIFEKDDRILLVQAKLKHLSPGTFFGYDMKNVVTDIEGPLSELVWKSMRFLYNIYEGSKSNRLSSETKAVSEKILQAKEIFFLGIVPAMPSIFHIDRFRNKLRSAIQRALKVYEWSWLGSNKGRYGGFRWHIMDWEELAAFTSTRDDESLLDMLVKYQERSDFGLIFKELPDHIDIVPSFRSWFLIRKQPKKGEPIKELNSIFERVFSNTLPILFPGKKWEPHRFSRESGDEKIE